MDEGSHGRTRVLQKTTTAVAEFLEGCVRDRQVGRHLVVRGGKSKI